MTLMTETNTEAMGAKVLTAARKHFGTRKLNSFFEHGQWWIENARNGAQYSVCDCERNGVAYFEFEQVTNGDDE